MLPHLHFFPSWHLYEDPVVAVTNYHKAGGLKQQELTFSQFWRLQGQNQGGGGIGVF